MEQLKTFQRQFEAGAEQFLGMIHLVKWFRITGIDSEHKDEKFEPDKLGTLPLAILNQANRRAVETPSEYEPTREKIIWLSDPDYSSYDKDFFERHWLLRPEDLSWDKAQALATLKRLAKNAACYFIDKHKSPVISSICAEIGTKITSATLDEKYIQRWLLVVRHLQPTQTIKRVFDAEHNSLSAAENGKPCFSTIDDVFSQSALACGELLDRLKATPTITDSGGRDNQSQKQNDKPKVATNLSAESKLLAVLTTKMRNDHKPTITAIAKEAGVSRSTAHKSSLFMATYYKAYPKKAKKGKRFKWDDNRIDLATKDPEPKD